MAKFIRLDTKGEWRGTEHVSSLLGLAEEWEGAKFEDGISCYDLSDKAEAIEALRHYWVEIASLDSIEDYEDKQITVFEGEQVGEGSDWEVIATCEKTIKELEAKPIFEKIFEAEENYEDNLDEGMDREEAEEQYMKELEQIEL